MEFYREPPELISQGDIVSDIPWGLIEAPTLLCRPSDRKQPSGKSQYSVVDPWALKNGPKPWTQNPEFIHAIGWQGPAMVLWHDCQIEKSENQGRADRAFAAIAPIHSLDKLQTDSDERTQGLRTAVRLGQHHSYYFLPAVTSGDFSLPDSFVNLRYIWSVRQSGLSKRVASLQAAMLPSLYEKMFIFFTRFRLDIEPKCPSCGTAVPLVMASDEDEKAD